MDSDPTLPGPPDIPPPGNPDPPAASPPRRPRRRLGRVGLVAGLVVTVVLAGGAATWAAASAGSDGSGQAGSTDGHDHDHADPAASTDALEADETAEMADMAEVDAAGLGTDDHMSSGAAGHHHPPLPPYEPRYQAASADQQAAADALVADVRSTLAPYADPAAAEADGYRPPANPRGRIQHYLNPAVSQEATVLDPTRPNGLLYLADGAAPPRLLGAFFIAPPGVTAPTPAGELVVWHSHNPSCPGFFATEAEPCTEARRMLHVWTFEQAEVTTARTGRAVTVSVADPFGTPFRAAVEPTP